jgi:two-component sensor histidine kinase
MKFVSPWASDDFCMEVGLLVTELVTNAVVHGLPAIHLQVCILGAARVRVEVFDGSLSLPEMREPSLESTSGRGLQLVAGIASRWGARPQLNGKVVWCELADRRS